MKSNIHIVATIVSLKFRRDGVCSFPQIVYMLNNSTRNFSHYANNPQSRDLIFSNSLQKGNLPSTSFRTFAIQRIKEQKNKSSKFPTGCNSKDKTNQQDSSKETSLTQPKRFEIVKARIDEVNIAEREVDKELIALLQKLETTEYDSYLISLLSLTLVMKNILIK